MVPERPSVQWVDDRASAGSDDRSGLSAGLGDGRLLGLAERRLAMRAQIVGHGRAVKALEDRIGVDERAVEPLGDLATDGRLAAARHADQHDARSHAQASVSSSATSASRMTWTGASRPVQSVKESAAWRRSTSAPLRATAPTARASRTRRVGLGR